MKKCSYCGKIKIGTIIWDNGKCIEKKICRNPKCIKFDKNIGLFQIR